VVVIEFILFFEMFCFQVKCTSIGLLKLVHRREIRFTRIGSVFV